MESESGSETEEEVERVDIIPAIRFDHSAITLHINGIGNTSYGPSFWKLNAKFIGRLRICQKR